MAKEAYLGDGLHASFDGYQFWLRASREEVTIWLALPPPVMAVFMRNREGLNRRTMMRLKVPKNWSKAEFLTVRWARRRPMV